MGTNYYWIDDYVVGESPADPDDSDIIRHIGKRSAAGPYCWPCGVTLCKGGSREVHYGHFGFYDKCPNCDGKASDGPTSVGVELGFTKAAEVQKSGVSSCCSFTWTMMSHKHRLQGMLFDEAKCVVDEYGNRFTAAEFLQSELSHVSIEAQHATRFS